MTRVFLVDDHEIVRRGIRELFADHPDLHIVGEAGSVADALATVPADADVAILDVRLPDGNGVELCRELRNRIPQLKCLMLTSYTDDDALLDAVMAGASGFVLKQVLGVDLIGSVRAVGEGKSLLQPRDVDALRARMRSRRIDPLAELSAKEREVFDLISQGLTNKQIGQRMFLSDKTVKNYVSQILRKLDLQRRAQLAAMAAELDTPRREPGT
mgnify:CR=1 FL=1